MSSLVSTLPSLKSQRWIFSHPGPYYHDVEVYLFLGLYLFGEKGSGQNFEKIINTVLVFGKNIDKNLTILLGIKVYFIIKVLEELNKKYL